MQDSRSKSGWKASIDNYVTDYVKPAFDEAVEMEKKSLKGELLVFIFAIGVIYLTIEFVNGTVLT